MRYTSVQISRELRQRYRDDGLQVCWAWCNEILGPPMPSGQRWTWDTQRIFFFEDEQDAVWFKLRWG